MPLIQVLACDVDIESDSVILKPVFTGFFVLQGDLFFIKLHHVSVRMIAIPDNGINFFQ
ncbi:MAG: hypothetical protein PHW13_09925 [Methylococcales bacterium]|nr:hypothetical protein [Methylococcales bacterium]